MSHGTTSLRKQSLTYIAVFASLAILTGLTVGVAQVDLGLLNTAVALVIAVSKAALVMLFFMHLISSNRATWTVVIVGAFFLLVALCLTLADYVARYA